MVSDQPDWKKKGRGNSGKRDIGNEKRTLGRREREFERFADRSVETNETAKDEMTGFL